MGTDNRVCFVISPIGSDGSDTRKRSDQILKHVIAPTAEHFGLEAIRGDKIADPGMITNQIIEHIISDALVVADLTGSNPNVFYELAIRHAIRKPFIQIIQKDEKIPFDLSGMRTIYIDHKDLDSVSDSIVQLKNQIAQVLGKEPDQIESPITVSVDILSLRRSDNPEQRSLADIVTMLSELKGEIRALQRRSEGIFMLSGDSNHLLQLREQAILDELSRLVSKTKLKDSTNALELLMAVKSKALSEVAKREFIRHALGEDVKEELERHALGDTIKEDLRRKISELAKDNVDKSQENS